MGWSEATGDEAMESVVEIVGDGEARYWLTETLPAPEAVEVQAKVEEAQ